MTKKIGNSFVLLSVAIQTFFLSAFTEHRQVYDNAPRVTLNLDNQVNNMPSGGCFVHCGIKNSATNRSMRSEELQSPLGICSRQLQNHFLCKISPVIAGVLIRDHCYAAPGFLGPRGVRELFMQASNFAPDDKHAVEFVNSHLAPYCKRIEDIVFDAQGQFKEALIFEEKVKLAHIFADFLKEFYPEYAQVLFARETQTNLALQAYTHEISDDWWKTSSVVYDSSKEKQVNALYDCPLNKQFGVVFMLLRNGDVVQARACGMEPIAIKEPGRFYGKITTHSSVFTKYPAIQKSVEAAYQHKLAIEKQVLEKRIAEKQAAIYQQCKQLRNEYVAYNECAEWQSHQDILIKRLSAVERDMSGAQRYESVHAMAPETVKLFGQSFTADQKGIVFTGGQLQHAFVDEAATIVDTVIEMNDGVSLEPLSEAIIDITNAAVEANNNGDLVQASRTLDACWMLVDCIRKVGRDTYGIIKRHMPIAIPVIEGIGAGLGGTLHMVVHPIDTATDIATALVVGGYYLGKAAYASSECRKLLNTIEPRTEITSQMMEDYFNEPSTLSVLYEYAKTTTKEDLIRAGTKFGTDIMLFNGIAKFVSSIARNSMPILLKCIRKGSQSVEVAITAEGIPVRCAEELNSLMSTMQNIDGGATGGTAKQTVKEAEAIAEVAKGAKEALEAFNVSKYDPSIGDLSKLEEAIEIFKDTPGSLSDNGPLWKALQCGLKTTQNKLGTARGAMYEMEKSVELYKKGEKIIHLGKKIDSREFDIITSNRWIECKNIDWAQCVGKAAEKMREGLGSRKAIAHKKGEIFELHSKNPIPKEWVDWLIEKGIKFIDDRSL